MIICAFENPPSIPSFLVTKIVYIGYGSFMKPEERPYLFHTKKLGIEGGFSNAQMIICLRRH
jgi:hypothetical protein